MKIQLCFRLFAAGALAGSYVFLSAGTAAANYASVDVFGVSQLDHRVPACTKSKGKAPDKNKHCDDDHPVTPK
jgi:hypothetical protein